MRVTDAFYVKLWNEQILRNLWFVYALWWTTSKFWLKQRVSVSVKKLPISPRLPMMRCLAIEVCQNFLSSQIWLPNIIAKYSKFQYII